MTWSEVYDHNRNVIFVPESKREEFLKQRLPGGMPKYLSERPADPLSAADRKRADNGRRIKRAGRRAAMQLLGLVKEGHIGYDRARALTPVLQEKLEKAMDGGMDGEVGEIDQLVRDLVSKEVNG